MSTHPPARPALWPPDTGRRGMGVAPTVVIGIVVIVVFIGGFGAWGALASLDTAAIAQGRVSVHGKRKTAEHLEGGIVSDILVEEGDVVEAGQTLIVLDDTQSRASFSLLENQYNATAALRSRLQAERDGLAEIPWLERLREGAGSKDFLEVQQRIFKARRRSLDNRAAIFRQRIAQSRAEVAGLEEEIDAQDQQIDLLEDELGGLGDLVAQGYEVKTRYLGLQRARMEIIGARARNRAQIARVRRSIGETQLEIAELGNAHLNEVMEELRASEARMSDLRERLSAARDVLLRTRVTAPVAGTVMDLRVFTRGGVVGPGEPLMDIVPAGDRFIIETRIDPMDIDVVHPDLPAQVRLTPFSHLATPILAGKVVQVSADSLVDERTGTLYFEARVALDPDQPQLRNLTLRPGMPVEVMIVTGKRTPIDYLLNPVVTSLRRALREQ